MEIVSRQIMSRQIMLLDFINGLPREKRKVNGLKIFNTECVDLVAPPDLILQGQEDGKIVDEKRLNVLHISPPESPESSPINETSKLLQDYEDGEPKDDVVQKHGSQVRESKDDIVTKPSSQVRELKDDVVQNYGSHAKPDPSEMKKIAAEGILTCLQDAIDFLNKGEVFVRAIFTRPIKRHEELSDIRIAKSKHAQFLLFLAQLYFVELR
nr:DNA-repair protein XRCC1 isoform X3 [Tanacetum cinerariifolium]